MIVRWVILAATLVTALVLRIRLLEIPLERDEGEYAYVGQLMLGGIPPYQLAYNMKWPGSYASYAGLMALFGQTIAGIHLGLVLVNGATILLLFLLGRRLFDLPTGIATASSYALLSLSPSVLGFALHANHLVVLPVVGGLFLLTNPASPRSRIVLASGALFGASLLVKQHAFFFVPLGAGYLMWRDWQARLPISRRFFRNLVFLCGAALPVAFVFLLLFHAGVWERFWFWTVVYAREYGTLKPLSEGLGTFLSQSWKVLTPEWALWTLAALGLLVSFLDRRLRARAPLLLAFLACSVLAFSVGFYFRRHYFILLLPPVCLLVGLAVASAERFCAERLSPVLRFGPWLCLAATLVSGVVAQRAFFFAPDLATASRSIYGPNPFPEAVRIAEFLRGRTGPDDTIAVLGSEPEIYFYSGRRSATGYIYTYSLVEQQAYALQMQREMIREIEAARPKYLVVVAVSFSWLATRDSEQLIFDWMKEYIPEHYAVVGLADMVTEDQTDYYLPASSWRTASSSYSIVVHERRD